MPEATIDENGHFVCGFYKWIPDMDIINVDLISDDGADYYWIHIELDDLYAVLHARHMAQAVDKTYLAKIEQAVKEVNNG